VLRILKIEGFSNIAATQEKKLAKRYLGETFRIRIRRITIQCNWRHILMIHIDTKGLILKKAGE